MLLTGLAEDRVPEVRAALTLTVTPTLLTLTLAEDRVPGAATLITEQGAQSQFCKSCPPVDDEKHPVHHQEKTRAKRRADACIGNQCDECVYMGVSFKPGLRLLRDEA